MLLCQVDLHTAYERMLRRKHMGSLLDEGKLKKRALKLKRKSESERVVAGVVVVTVTHSEAPGEGPPSPTSLLLPV